jgi:paraquat-inducible protein A
VESLLACPDCDAVQTAAAPAGRDVHCFRCGAVVARGGRTPLAVARAYTLAAVPLFIAACAYPLMQMKGASAAHTTVVGAAAAMQHQRLPALALLVLLTTLVLPAVELAASAHLLLRGTRERPALAGMALRVREAVRPWSQVEILLLAVVVAFTKLASVFRMTPGLGLLCLVGFLLLQGLATRALDPRALWRGAT